MHLTVLYLDQAGRPIKSYQLLLISHVEILECKTTFAYACNSSWSQAKGVRDQDQLCLVECWKDGSAWASGGQVHIGASSYLLHLYSSGWPEQTCKEWGSQNKQYLGTKLGYFVKTECINYRVLVWYWWYWSITL